MSLNPNYNNHKQERHYVYRIFDKDGRLIYVGCSHNPEKRLNQHRRTMWWAHQIHRIKLTVHPNKAAGHLAERTAINAEQPRWNLTGRWVHRATWTSQDYADYITASLNGPEVRGVRLQRVEKARRLMQVQIAKEQQRGD